MPSLKDEIIAVIKKMPDDADITDIMAELYAMQSARIISRKPQTLKPIVENAPRRPGRPKKQT